MFSKTIMKTVALTMGFWVFAAGLVLSNPKSGTGVSQDDALQKLMDGNNHYIENNQTNAAMSHSATRTSLIKSQKPYAIILTCSANNQPDESENEISIEQLEPDSRGGKAYRLVYLVKVPIDVYWKFKTDFDNRFLVSNKYIREHHFISRSDSSVITENKYANAPDVFFRWRTSVFPEAHRLDFVLLNPEACQQKFHYGSIQLDAVKGGTRVTQAAYFDFWGVFLWAHNPFGGGMRDFLIYTARWEQKIALELKYRYAVEAGK